MAFFELILGIVAITTLAGLVNNFISFKSKNSDSMDNIEKRIHQIEGLEERVKILEKIITDQNYDLDQKIKSL